MKNLKGCYSHNTDDWRTPSHIYNAFMRKGYVDCFPFQSKENELNNTYFDSKLFINPPYSKMKKVTKWILDQVHQNNKVALLIPSRTDTSYFCDLLVGEYCDVIFIKGRLKFNDSDKVAPFPSILLLYNYLDNTFPSIVSNNSLHLFINEYL